MNYLSFNLSGHAGETHVGGGETLSHYFATDQNVLLVSALVWLAFFAGSAYLVKKSRRPHAGTLFGLANVLATVFLGQAYFFASLVLLTAGFGLIFYNLFKKGVCLCGPLLQRGRKTKGGGRARGK